MIEWMPGAYLHATRIRSARGLVSYLWLEVLPFVAVLALASPRVAWQFVALHWVVLSLYEIGYLINDRAASADERDPGLRPRAAMPPSRLAVFVGVRAVLVLGSTAWLAQSASRDNALTFLCMSVAVLAMSCLHTWAGTAQGPTGRARWITFAWLAYGKYLPALVATVGWAVATEISVAMFLIYGGGRVLEYVLIKQGAREPLIEFKVQLIWAIASLPVAVGYCLVMQPPLLVLVGVIVAHHVTRHIAVAWRKEAV